MSGTITVLKNAFGKKGFEFLDFRAKYHSGISIREKRRFQLFLIHKYCVFLYCFDFWLLKLNKLKINCDEKTIKRPKGGAEKARLKRSLGIKAAGNDPKQNKFTFNLIWVIFQKTAYFRKETNLTIKRTWLTYSKSNDLFFCTFCLAFSAEDNQFTIGCLASSSSNLYTRISEHERSKNHENNFEAFLLNSNMSDITQYLLAERDMKLIHIIKLIGKQGLSYRGAKDAEAAYTLNDPSFDHGNFLEMVMLLSKYDPVLKEHTDRAIYKSQKSNNRQTVSRPGQPVGLVTFLSKTTVDYIIEIIGSLMKTTIAENIRKVPFFTIQIDSTTQDVNVHDQLAIIIRFTTDDINEKLLAIIDCKTGKVKIYVILYNHLSKYMYGVMHMCLNFTTLFGLLNSIAMFVRESYLRMNKWHENSKYKFISCIGDTRWWAKNRCLTKVFGTYLNPNECLYVEIIQTLNEIYESNLLKMCALKQNVLLMTKGMNVVHAFSNVKTTISTLQSKARDFNHIKDLTRTFIEWANCKMDDIELDYNIEEKFPMKRIKKKKKIPGEIADDEAQTDPMLKFNINVYNVIYDQIITSLKKRFETHGQFYNDLQFLIPEYFTNNLPSTVFEWISKKLKKFDSNISPGSIQSELKDFIEKWPKMKNIASATITINDDDVQENNEEDKNEENNTASSISLCLKLNENLAWSRRKRVERAQQLPEQIETRNAAQRIRTAESRARETQEQRDERLQQNIMRTRAARERNIATVRERDRQRQRISRSLTRASFVRLAFEYAPDINYSAHSKIAIGEMDKVCQYCQALKFRNEAAGMCCASGKVVLSPLPTPPEPLLSLLTGNSDDSILFLRKIRKFNSCFQMTSFGATKI
ncbi:hypothetical protein QTP88_004542 [Uroleucon formosanum]